MPRDPGPRALTPETLRIAAGVLVCGLGLGSLAVRAGEGLQATAAGASLAVLVALPLFLLLRSLAVSKGDPFEAGNLFLLFFLLNFSVPAVLLVWNPGLAVFPEWPRHLLGLGMSYSSLALVVFWVGYRAFPRLALRLARRCPRFSSRYSVVRAEAAFLILFAAVLGIAGFWLHRSGSLAAYFLTGVWQQLRRTRKGKESGRMNAGPKHVFGTKTVWAGAHATTIVFPSRVLKPFLNGLDLALTKPQRRRLGEVVRAC